MSHTVKFVDSIASSPTTRLDLSDGSTWQTVADGTEFPPPPLRRAAVSTLLADGARIPAAAYDNRVLRLNLNLMANSADGQATEIQKLARELNRPNNILRWAPDSMTNPVFFRTLRSDISHVVETLPTLRNAVVEVLAEPFAYGLKQTLSPVTVNNDPANGSNGLFWDVSGVLGDVETPAVFKFVAGDVFDSTKRQSLLAVRRRGTPSSMPFLVQAESCTTNGADTTVQTTDATMSGATNNYTRTTFATTATLSKRLTFPTPSDSVDLRGTYRVYARYRHSVSGDSISVQLKWNNGLNANDAVTLPSGTLTRFVDLGLMSFPAQPDPIYDGYSNVEQVVSGVNAEFWAGRNSGSGNLDIDYFLYAPADDQVCLVKWASTNTANYSAILDGVNEMAYLLDDTNSVVNLGSNELVGGFPLLSPAQTNRIVFVRDIGSTAGATDAVTGTSSITLSYWPRYLYVRPAAT